MVLKRGGRNLFEVLRDLDAKKTSDEFFDKLSGDLVEAGKLLHDARITHADLKPGNILVDLSESLPSLMVIDFGSCRKSHVSRPCEVTTINFLDPAHIFGSEDVNDGVGRDIYALGLILVQLLLKGTALYEMMESVNAPEDLLEYMESHWEIVESSLCHERSDEEKIVIVNNLWRYLVFCHTDGGYVMNWIQESWPRLGAALSRFQREDIYFAADTQLYSLQNGTETACIRANRKLFATETVAVWALLTIFHPVSEERTSLEDFAKIVGYLRPAPSPKRKPARKGGQSTT